MSKKINYSKLSLLEIVKKITKKNIFFSELDDNEKINILNYIKRHNINIKVFGNRWYDILTNRFYVEEYFLINKFDKFFGFL